MFFNSLKYFQKIYIYTYTIKYNTTKSKQILIKINRENH